MAQSMVTQTLRPVYLAALARGDEMKAKRTFVIWLAIVVIVCAVGLAMVIALRDWIGLLFLAPEFRDGVIFMPWIALGYAIYAVGQVLVSYLQAQKRTMAWMLAELCGALVSVPVTIVLVRQMGAFGAAVACPIYCSVIFMWLLISSRTNPTKIG
jgi:O-antigen/teichoic acid export membrane protein